MFYSNHTLYQCLNMKYGHETSEFHVDTQLCCSTLAEQRFNNNIMASCAKKLPQSLLLVIKAFSSKAATITNCDSQVCGLMGKKKN